MKSRLVILPLILSFLAVLSLSVVGCGKWWDKDFNDGKDGGTDENWQERMYFDPNLPEGTLMFTYPPSDIGSFNYIIPLGNMNPSAHTIPTDHIYFVHDSNGAGKPIYAPAGGKVLDIFTFHYGSGYDNRINVGVTKTSSYYIVHVVLDKNIKVGDFINAGQKIGVISSYASAFDLGVVNRNVVQPFLNKDRYGYSSIYGDSPFKYFAQSLRDQLYSKVLRKAPDKDGKFCYDQPGRLIGNWFDINTPSN